MKIKILKEMTLDMGKFTNNITSVINSIFYEENKRLEEMPE